MTAGFHRGGGEALKIPSNLGNEELLYSRDVKCIFALKHWSVSGECVTLNKAHQMHLPVRHSL